MDLEDPSNDDMNTTPPSQSNVVNNSNSAAADVKTSGTTTIPSSPVRIPIFKSPYQGADADTLHNRNLWAAKKLDSMFNDTRLKRCDSSSNCVSSSSWFCSLFVVVLYSPIGILLLLLRILIGFPLSGCLFSITPRSKSTGMFRCIACCCYGNVYSYKRMKPTTEEEITIQQELQSQKQQPKIIVANHTTEMDVLPIRANQQLRIMGYDMYHSGKLGLFLKCSPLKFLDMLYIKQTERTAGGGKDRDAVREQVIEGLSDPNCSPLLVFPEGGLTTGKHGLLQFHKFLFSLEHVVQPIVLKPKGGPLPIHIDNNFGTTIGNILYYAFQPWQRFDVVYLPPAKRRTNEDPLDFARRVMSNIAKERGCDASPFLYRDKRIYSKMKLKLYHNGFRYRFVSTRNQSKQPRNLKNAKVSPEELLTVENEIPKIILRSRIGLCCGPSSSKPSKITKDLVPVDYLAKSIMESFRNEDGSSKSQVFEVESEDKV